MRINDSKVKKNVPVRSLNAGDCFYSKECNEENPCMVVGNSGNKDYVSYVNLRIGMIGNLKEDYQVIFLPYSSFDPG